MPLTKIECDRAACPAGRPAMRLSDAKGMYLEVTAAGGKYWRMKYRHAGKEKRLALGVYPVVSLAQARKACEQAREALSSGNDPAQLKREAKLTKAVGDASTFEKVARQWWEHWRGPKSPRHANYVLRRLEAMLAVADLHASLIITGTGDVLEPEHGIISIGSGGAFAQAAAKALLDNTELSPAEIVKKSLEIAADLCIYTNMHHTIETL